MKNNIMKKWVKALRYGKFKQGTGTLKQFNSKGQPQHCCLGVLCELYNQEMKKNKKKMLREQIFHNDSDFSHGYTTFSGIKENLPKIVKIWSGIHDSVGTFTNSSGELNTLADLNDFGRKFKTIANIIEKNWESL